MRKRLDERAKTLRAFRAYLDLQARTDWIRAEMRGQLQTFDMTLAGFRVLELLYRGGPTHINETASRLESDRRNLYVVVRALEKRGLVGRVKGRLQLVDNKRNRELKAMGDRGLRGRGVTRLRLTPPGGKFIANLFPRHAKVVKSLMRALPGREQETLSKLCRKLRRGDFRKFVTEWRYLRVGEDFEIDPEGLKRELQGQKPHPLHTSQRVRHSKSL